MMEVFSTLKADFNNINPIQANPPAHPFIRWFLVLNDGSISYSKNRVQLYSIYKKLKYTSLAKDLIFLCSKFIF